MCGVTFFTERKDRMRIAQRTLLCVLLNLAGVLAMVVFILEGATRNQDIFAFGPSPDLRVMQVPIDTWKKYWSLLGCMCFLRSLDVFVNDIGSPNLGFSIYNPTTRTVYGFTKNQLQLLANGMWLVNSVGGVFRLMVSVSRLDVALISAFASELASVFTIRYLLNQKTGFIPERDFPEEAGGELDPLIP